MGPSEFDDTNRPEAEAERPALDVPDPREAGFAETPAPEASAPPAEEEEEEIGVEPEGFATGLMTGVIVLTIALLAVAIVVVSFWVRVWFEEEAAELAAEAQYPLYQETQTRADRLLGGYGVVDAEAGVYRIPIDRAMDLMLEETHTAAQARAE